MREFCEALARKDLEYVNGLSREDLEQVLKMQAYAVISSPILWRGRTSVLHSENHQAGHSGVCKTEAGAGIPGGREMKRRFILHVGPTNSGKTHDALERLKECRHGAYFGPLRLLALEVYDKLNSEGLACSMITGEETLEVPGACARPVP